MRKSLVQFQPSLCPHFCLLNLFDTQEYTSSMAEDINRNIMPKIVLLPRLEAVGKFVGRLFHMPHQLSPISDHHFEHPLELPADPVTSLNFPEAHMEEYWHGVLERPVGIHSGWDVVSGEYESAGSYWFKSDGHPDDAA